MITPEYELISRDNAPQNASFSLCVSDDCMEPDIRAGERVFVCADAAPDEMGVGVFMYEGRVVCRKWCEDYSGAVHLLASNPARADANITVPKSKRGALTCLGKVLSK